MSSKVTTKELLRMRDDIEAELMPDTCVILSATDTADGPGAFTATWGTLTTNVPCRLDAISGRQAEKYIAAGVDVSQSYMLTVPSSTGLTGANRIVHEGITYSVKPVSAGSWIVAQRAIVTKV